LPEPEETPPDQERAIAESKRLGFVAASLASVLQPLIDQQEVKVTHNGSWVEVTMRSTLLFPSGSARLSGGAMKILRDVSRVLKPVPNSVHVEGYTDNVPINTAAYPSNWELSAARAASVVHLFTRLGIAPERLAAVGYGEHRPVADNDTEGGRSRNRRVSLIISADQGAAGQLGLARGGRE
jgi:chemotaxis protein MotB